MPKRFRPLLRVTCLLLALSLVVMGVFAKRGYLDYERMIRENRELTARTEAARRERAELDRRSEALKSDAAEQERIIRGTLGYVRPEETVIEFP